MTQHVPCTTELAEHPDGWRVVTIRGAVDLYETPGLKSLLLDAVAAGGGHAIVDLTAVTFLDSGGLAALLGAHRKSVRMGGRLVVVNVDADIARTFAVTGLDDVLPIAATVDDACRHLATSEAG